MQCWANRESAGFSALVFQISELEKASFLGRGGDFGFGACSILGISVETADQLVLIVLGFGIWS